MPMPRNETTKVVPNDKVQQVKEDFESEGATVVVTDNKDGTSTVVATFPN